MSDFGAQLKAFNDKVLQRSRDVFVNCATDVQGSVVEGSAVTGAPGQPVDTATLRDSYIPEFTSQWTWQTTTNVEYALPIENGIQTVYLGDGKYTYRSPIHFRSTVGGSHSVALTKAGWPRIVDAVVERVVGE